MSINQVVYCLKSLSFGMVCYSATSKTNCKTYLYFISLMISWFTILPSFLFSQLLASFIEIFLVCRSHVSLRLLSWRSMPRLLLNLLDVFQFSSHLTLGHRLTLLTTSLFLKHSLPFIHLNHNLLTFFCHIRSPLSISLWGLIFRLTFTVKSFSGLPLGLCSLFS